MNKVYNRWVFERFPHSGFQIPELAKIPPITPKNMADGK